MANYSKNIQKMLRAPMALLLLLLIYLQLAVASAAVLEDNSSYKPSYKTPHNPLAWRKALLHVTAEPDIQKALLLLFTTPGESSVRFILDHPQDPIRIAFRDLATLNPLLARYDAVSWLQPTPAPPPDEDADFLPSITAMPPAYQHWIYINQRHQNVAPPQALAALIAHEVLHHDAFNSKQEEIAGWTMEALVWQALRPQLVLAKKLPKNSLLYRLEVLAKAQQSGTLAQLVRQNKAYEALEETSPGFLR